MVTLERALNSIGKQCFVDNYEAFRTCSDKKQLAQKLLSENLRAYSLSAQLSRINYAKWIFDSHREKEALLLIIRSGRLNNDTIKKARDILSGI